MSFVLFFAGGALATLIGLRDVLLTGRGRLLGAIIIVLTLVAIFLCLMMWLALARRWLLQAAKAKKAA